MVEQTWSTEDREKLWKILKDIGIGMFVTHSGNDPDALSARPMGLVGDSFDGTLYFMTPASTPKISELQENADVLIAFAHPGKQHYVSVSGNASVSKDRAKIKELWSELYRTWFPKGPDDPEISLITVQVKSAEYWDAPSSAVVYAYGYLKARLTGERPDPGENKLVKF